MLKAHSMEKASFLYCTESAASVVFVLRISTTNHVEVQRHSPALHAQKYGDMNDIHLQIECLFQISAADRYIQAQVTLQVQVHAAKNENL